MEVLVRKPPVFTIEPDSMYQRKVGETVEMHCDAQETEGTQKPTIQWQRVSVRVHFYVQSYMRIYWDINTLRTGYLNCLNARSRGLNHVNQLLYCVSLKIYNKFANYFCELKFSGNTHQRP